MEKKKPEEVELTAHQLKEIREKKEIIKQLNDIKWAISATVFSHNMTWTIRNKAFWLSLKGKDEAVQEFIEKYLTEVK